jgi:hypothetical protein
MTKAQEESKQTVLDFITMLGGTTQLLCMAFERDPQRTIDALRTFHRVVLIGLTEMENDEDDSAAQG